MTFIRSGIRSEIRANRQKWAEFLMEPEREKVTLMMDNGAGGRCCLGHGCYILNVVREQSIPSHGNFFMYGQERNSSTAPREFIELVGLWGAWGNSKNGTDSVSNPLSFPNVDKPHYSLTTVNDETTATPQEIGAYLLSVIEGGDDTPFRPLSDYPESYPEGNFVEATGTITHSVSGEAEPFVVTPSEPLKLNNIG